MMNGFDKLTRFLNQLEQAKIAYTLAHHRDETVMVMVAIPGERWEVEFFGSGAVEIERFASKGDMGDESMFAELFAAYAEEPVLSTVH